jgi:hypothetical protein
MVIKPYNHHHKYLLDLLDDCVISAKWGRFYDNDLNTFILEKESVWRDMLPIDWIVEALTSGSIMLQCALWLIPRKVLLKSGLWNNQLTLNNDFDFFIRVLLASRKVLFSEDSILYYRSGIVNSLSKRNDRESFLSGINSNLLGTSFILQFENSQRTRNACIKNLETWMYQTYPKYKDLSKTVQNKLSDLGANRFNYWGGKFSRILVFLFGWKVIANVLYYYRWLIRWLELINQHIMKILAKIKSHN